MKKNLKGLHCFMQSWHPNKVIFLCLFAFELFGCQKNLEYDKVSKLLENMIEERGPEGYLFLMSEFDCKVCTRSMTDWEPEICLVQKKKTVWALGLYYLEPKSKSKLPGDLNSTCINWQTSNNGKLFGAVVSALKTKEGPYVIKIIDNKIVYIKAVNGNTFE